VADMRVDWLFVTSGLVLALLAFAVTAPLG
jgi:hypothetical protein